MTIITLQILVTFQVLIWFDWMKPHHFIMWCFGYPKWSTKKDLPFLLKWLGGYFCTSNWIGIINAGVFFCVTNDHSTALLLIASNLIISRLFDYLLGYQSFKP